MAHASAVKHRHLNAGAAVHDLDQAVSKQGLRISIALNQRFRREMDTGIESRG